MRNLWASNLLENFLIMAVAAILGIRLGLHLTGYPQLGGGGLHIAHMLWGGLGMLVAIILMLEFSNRTAREWAAIVGGIGFGTFIDELGKFITSDNNYFYQPSIAVIYVIFISLFLSIRWINHSSLLSQSESMANATEIIQEGIHAGGLDDEERLAALELLKSSNTQLAGDLRCVLEKFTTLPMHRPGVLARTRYALAIFYSGLASRGWFRWLVIGIFLADAVAGLAFIMLDMEWSWPTAAAILGGCLALWALFQFTNPRMPRGRISRCVFSVALAAVIGIAMLVNLRSSLGSFDDWVELITTMATTVLIIIGALVMHRSRLKAYLWFRGATLISILVTDVFAFYQYQFVALGDLALDMLLFLALRYMIDREKGALQANSTQIPQAARIALPRCRWSEPGSNRG